MHVFSDCLCFFPNKHACVPFLKDQISYKTTIKNHFHKIPRDCTMRVQFTLIGLFPGFTVAASFSRADPGAKRRKECLLQKHTSPSLSLSLSLTRSLSLPLPLSLLLPLSLALSPCPSLSFPLSLSLTLSFSLSLYLSTSLSLPFSLALSSSFFSFSFSVSFSFISFSSSSSFFFSFSFLSLIIFLLTPFLNKQLEVQTEYNQHSEPHSLEVLRELQVHWQKKDQFFIVANENRYLHAVWLYPIWGTAFKNSTLKEYSICLSGGLHTNQDGSLHWLFQLMSTIWIVCVNTVMGKQAGAVFFPSAQFLQVCAEDQKPVSKMTL